MADKRGAIELSINFIVIILISVVILGSGIYLTSKIFSGSEKISTELDQRTKEAIEDSLRDSPVSIPFNNMEANRGDTKIYGVGVMNMLGYTTDFTIIVTESKWPSGATRPIPVYIKDSFKLDDSQTRISQIVIKAPKDAARGQYSYKVDVQYYDQGWQLYQTKIIYLTIK